MQVAASGFQLLNVQDVPIRLRGLRLDNRLASRNDLKRIVVRHYTLAMLSEAHKVLGGAGPAIAQVW